MLEKIKEFFKKLFNKEIIKEIDTVRIEKNINKEDSFLESIRVNDNTDNIKLIEKICNKDIAIKELTDEELDNLLLFYRNKLGLQN